jgi:selenocysteine lyase/cysteine desulfurase
MLADIGLDNIERYVRELTTYAIECADAYGIRIRTPRPWMQRAGTISLALEENGEAVVARLRQRNIICSLKDGNVRISPHFYNTRDEIDLFFDALEKA